MAKTKSNIHDAHIIPDGELNGITCTLFSASDMLDMLFEAATNDETPVKIQNIINGMAHMVRGIADKLDALQGKSMAVNSEDAIVALAALMDSQSKAGKGEKVSA